MKNTLRFLSISLLLGTGYIAAAEDTSKKSQTFDEMIARTCPLRDKHQSEAQHQNECAELLRLLSQYVELKQKNNDLEWKIRKLSVPYDQRPKSDCYYY